MEKRKAWITCGVMGLAMALSAGGVVSFFTDRDEAINKFTVGKIDISLEEPGWEKQPDTDKNGIPDQAEKMVPGAEVVKDPCITNTGENDCYIFASVEVPVRDIITVQDNGMKNEKKPTRLYTYDIEKSWRPMGSCKVTDEKGVERGIRYLYAYADEKGQCIAVKKGDSTDPVFRKIRLANVMEGQGIEDQTFMVDVDAYAVQTDNIGKGSKDMNEIWSVMANQKDIKEQYR